MRKYFFTSESVTEGHPDKICDQISDAILDAMLAQDPQSRVACETTCTTGVVSVMGEISTKAEVKIPQIVREVVTDIGFDNPAYGFDGNTCAVLLSIDEQSADIAMGVDASKEKKDGDADAYNLNGAGDQGMMFGYACNETPELMPLAISLAHKLSRQLAAVRKDGTLPYLRPDGKSQVTVEYADGKPVRVDAVVISSQHDPAITQEQIRSDVIAKVIQPPPVGSLSAVPQGTAVLRAERLLWIHTAAMPATAAARFPAKIPPRWIAARRMRQDISLKMWLPPVLLTGARCSWHMPSALPARYRCMWILSEPAELVTVRWRR